MNPELPRLILQRAYGLNSALLDAQARSLGAEDWQSLTRPLNFYGYDTGGGCTMLVADLPDNHRLGLTDGDARFPTDAENFWVGVMTEDGDELVSLFSDGSN